MLAGLVSLSHSLPSVSDPALCFGLWKFLPWSSYLFLAFRATQSAIFCHGNLSEPSIIVSYGQCPRDTSEPMENTQTQEKTY